MARIGTSCPATMFDWQCKILGWETKTEAEQKKIEAEIKNAEQFYPSVKLNDGNLVNFYWLTKIQVIAGENTAGYNHIYSNNSIVRNVQKGDSFGTALYYVRANPGLWIGFKDYNGEVYWVYMKDKTIDAKRLYDKGIKNDVQQTQANNDKDKGFLDTLSENIGEGLKWGAVVVGAYLVYDVVKDNKPDKQTSVAGIKGLGLVELGLLSLGAYLLLKDEDKPKPPVATLDRARKGVKKIQTSKELNPTFSSVDGFSFDEFLF